MKLKRLLATTLGAALLGIVPVALIAAPAEAATATTRVKASSSPAKSVFVAGETITIQGSVQVYNPSGCGTADGWCNLSDTSNGKVELLRRIAGQDTWTILATDTLEPTFYFTTTSTGTADYVVRYSGGTVNSTSSYAPSQVGTTLKGKRKVTLAGEKVSGKLFIYGHVGPDYAGKVVYVHKKACGSCAWKKVGEVRTGTSANYRYRVYAPRSGSWYYRVRVPGVLPRWEATQVGSIRTYSY